MPGWHGKTEKWVADGKLAVAGIVTEQHGERAALFMQWHQMTWPVMVDSLNLLGVRAVPLTYLIDEHGVIRVVNPKGDAVEKFLSTDYAASGLTTPRFKAEDSATELAVKALVTAKPDPKALDAAIAADHRGAAGNFRHGVLLRTRHDSAARRPGDFAKAVAAWEAALKEVPGQYIWRRRIQQYGPRLDKPYPFYDWIQSAAIPAIEARGEKPLALRVPLSITERSSPNRRAGKGAQAGEDVAKEHRHPDPENKLPSDVGALVAIESIAVPSTEKRKQAHLVHIQLTPSLAKQAKWDLEAGQTEIWIDGKFFGAARPASTDSPEAASAAAQTLEFEFHGGAAKPLKASTFYFVCEGVDGTCQFLRHDFEIELK